MLEQDKRPRPLTPAMLAMLRNASAGVPLKTGLRGRSAHGGAEWTIIALRKRGYLTGNEITTEGLAVFKGQGSNERKNDGNEN